MQNQVISEKDESNLECCFAKKLFTCYWISFVKILKRKHEKDLRLVRAKVRYCLQKEIFFEVSTLFFPDFPKHRSITCFADGWPQLTLSLSCE